MVSDGITKIRARRREAGFAALNFDFFWAPRVHNTSCYSFQGNNYSFSLLAFDFPGIVENAAADARKCSQLLMGSMAMKIKEAHDRGESGKDIKMPPLV
jgi:hypothetical protein